MKNDQDIKQILLRKCTQYIDERIQSIQKKLNDIAESRSNETKSSAGDKHETGRTMMQLEEQKITVQLYAALDVRHTLDKINIESKNESIGLGSLAICNTGNFYLSISSGKMLIDNEIYYGISIQSPIGSQLAGRSKGDTFQFNGKTIQIKDVH